MDYARKNKSPNLTWKPKPESPVLHCGYPCIAKGDDPPEEDRRLVNWRRSINDRNRRQRKLSAALERGPLDLAINSHEKVRTKREDAELLRCASRPEIVNQDKYQGNPAFWNLDEILAEKRGIAPRMTRERKFLPPELERVGLPNLILKEKMLLQETVHPTNVNLRCKWDKGDYLWSRAEELKKEMEFLEPKRPELENLSIVGKNFQLGCKKIKFVRTPVISISQDEDLPTPKYLHHPDDRIALKIQDREFVLESGFYFERLSCEETLKLQESKKDRNINKYAYAVFETNRVYKILKKPKKTLTWNLHFKLLGNELDKQTFYLENRGSRVVYLEWRNITPMFNPKIDIADNRCDTPFYFNKNRFNILPGQKVDFSIWFRSELPLVASETWKLIIEPKVYPAEIHLRLWGHASGEAWKLRQDEAVQEIRDLVRCRLRDSTVREFINEIFMNATSQRVNEDVPYCKFFLEADVFRLRNPMHHYHSHLVYELRDMWCEEMDSDPQCWNMSLEELRKILLKIKDPEYRREKLIRFHELASGCLLPSAIYDRPACSRHRMTYWLIGSYFNRFEDESEFVFCKCCGIRCPSEPEVEGQESPGVASVAAEGAGETEVSLPYGFPQIYNEVLYVRMYCLLCETVDRVCAAVESYDYFNKETD